MRFDILYADCPWSYQDTQKSGGTAFFGAIVRYQTMPMTDIISLPITSIASKDSVLFLWVPSPLLLDGLQTIDSWGFKYKTIAFCWNKKTKNDKWVSNMGRWTMGNIELCLLGVRGHPQRVTKNIKQLVIAQRLEHSKKPDEVRNRIVQLMGDLPRVELFARQHTDGWVCLGSDITGNDIRYDLELIAAL